MFFPVTSINAGNVFIFAHHYTANGWLLTTVLEIQALLQELIIDGRHNREQPQMFSNREVVT